VKESHALITRRAVGFVARADFLSLTYSRTCRDRVLERNAADGSADAEAMIAAARPLDGTRHVARLTGGTPGQTTRETSSVRAAGRAGEGPRLHHPSNGKHGSRTYRETYRAPRPSDEEMTVESERQKTLNDS